MRRLVEKNVHGRFARWMRGGKHRWTGLTLPGPFKTTIRYWLLDDEMWPDPTFRLHERRHAQQVEMRGWFRWWCVWWWQTLRHGYRANELEVDARRAAGQP